MRADGTPTHRRGPARIADSSDSRSCAGLLLLDILQFSGRSLCLWQAMRGIFEVGLGRRYPGDAVLAHQPGTRDVSQESAQRGMAGRGPDELRTLGSRWAVTVNASGLSSG